MNLNLSLFVSPYILIVAHCYLFSKFSGEPKSMLFQLQFFLVIVLKNLDKFSSLMLLIFASSSDILFVVAFFFLQVYV